MADVVILDCYTDEPSGYGVRPYVGTHQLHLSQALEASGTDHEYLTIDDLRYCRRGVLEGPETDTSTLHTTTNRDRALDIVRGARLIYIVMGCFVQYQYFSCDPPRAEEVFDFLKDTSAELILFYVLGTRDGVSPAFAKSRLGTLISTIEHGNAYRFVAEGRGSTPADDLTNPDYSLLARIGRVAPPLLAQLKSPVITEIETGTGCNTPTCRFCIESVRAPRIQYRAPEDIIAQVGCFYDAGVRHFRLGRQPNFFHYAWQDVTAMERLLEGIRTRCPAIRMLHIDNVNVVNVITPAGRRFAELIATYCTSGNVAPLGVESFDPEVRHATGIVGSTANVFQAIEVLNDIGARRGSDGLPVLLPGVNLIDGLPGETSTTHDLNLVNLRNILDRGLMTYRLFYREMTPAAGVSMSGHSTPVSPFLRRFEDVVRAYVMPMQDRVYPNGTVIDGDWESIQSRDGVIARTYGTCSIRVRVQTAVTPFATHSVRVTRNVGYRILDGEVAL